MKPTEVIEKFIEELCSEEMGMGDEFASEIEHAKEWAKNWLINNNAVIAFTLCLDYGDEDEDETE